MAKERTRPTFLDVLIDQATGKGQRVGNEDDQAADKYPRLWQWLETLYVSKDKIKHPPAVMVQLSPGGVSVRITDRDLATSLEVQCEYLEQVWEALEGALSKERPAFKLFGKREPKLRTRQKLT